MVEVTRRRTPVVLLNSPTSLWPAVGKWTPEHLARTLPVLPLVYAHKRPQFMWYDNGRQMGREMGLRVHTQHYFRRNVSGVDFFSGASDGSRSDGVSMYLSEPLSSPPYAAAMSSGVQPRAFLSATADLPERGAQDAIVWAGDSGTSAHIHYGALEQRTF